MPHRRGTSHAAEAAAAVWGLLWCLRANGDLDFGSLLDFVLFADSLGSLDAAGGMATPHAEPELGAALRAAFHLAAGRLPSRLHHRLRHVPGHAGHPWNELVDVAATAAGEGWWVPPPALPGLAAFRRVSVLD